MQDVIDIDPKERIIEHAEEKFLQYGFNKVTLDEMSADLGISKKTMYKFFPSKEDLLRNVMKLLMNRVEKNIKTITESDGPVIQKLAKLMLLIGNLVGRISRPFQMDVQRFAPSLWKEVSAFRNEMILSRVAKMIREAKAEGKIRNDINEEVVLMMFISSVQAIINPEILSQHSFSPKEAMFTIFHVIFEGSLTEEARKEFLTYEITTV